MDQHIAEPGVNFPVEAAHINSKRYFVVKDRVPTDNEGYIGDVCFVISEEKNTPPEPEVLSPFELIRTVEFAGATSVEVDGVFKHPDDGGFNNYVVMMDSISTPDNAGPAQVKCVLRDENGDYTGGTYTAQNINANGTNVVGSRVANWNEFFYLYGWGLKNGNQINWYGPALAKPTAVRTVNIDSFGRARLLDVAGTHSESKEFSGFTFTITNASYPITGSLSVYGVRS